MNSTANPTSQFLTEQHRALNKIIKPVYDNAEVDTDYMVAQLSTFAGEVKKQDLAINEANASIKTIETNLQERTTEAKLESEKIKTIKESEEYKSALLVANVVIGGDISKIPFQDQQPLSKLKSSEETYNNCTANIDSLKKSLDSQIKIAATHLKAKQEFEAKILTFTNYRQKQISFRRTYENIHTALIPQYTEPYTTTDAHGIIHRALTSLAQNLLEPIETYKAHITSYWNPFTSAETHETRFKMIVKLSELMTKTTEETLKVLVAAKTIAPSAVSTPVSLTPVHLTPTHSTVSAQTQVPVPSTIFIAPISIMEPEQKEPEQPFEKELRDVIQNLEACLGKTTLTHLEKAKIAAESELSACKARLVEKQNAPDNESKTTPDAESARETLTKFYAMQVDNAKEALALSENKIEALNLLKNLRHLQLDLNAVSSDQKGPLFQEIQGNGNLFPDSKPNGTYSTANLKLIGHQNRTIVKKIRLKFPAIATARTKRKEEEKAREKSIADRAALIEREAKAAAASATIIVPNKAARYNSNDPIAIINAFRRQDISNIQVTHALKRQDINRMTEELDDLLLSIINETDTNTNSERQLEKRAAAAICLQETKKTLNTPLDADALLKTLNDVKQAIVQRLNTIDGVQYLGNTVSTQDATLNTAPPAASPPTAPPSRRPSYTLPNGDIYIPAFSTRDLQQRWENTKQKAREYWNELRYGKNRLRNVLLTLAAIATGATLAYIFWPAIAASAAGIALYVVGTLTVALISALFAYYRGAVQDEAMLLKTEETDVAKQPTLTNDAEQSSSAQLNQTLLAAPPTATMDANAAAPPPAPTTTWKDDLSACYGRCHTFFCGDSNKITRTHMKATATAIPTENNNNDNNNKGPDR